MSIRAVYFLESYHALGLSFELRTPHNSYTSLSIIIELVFGKIIIDIG